jgi:Mrp family chromosome partitioning ATPase
VGAAALAAAAGVIAKNLEVSTPARTDALVLHFSHPEADVAQEVLTRLIDAYLYKHDQIHHSLGHVEALTSQQEELLRRLTEADATVKERMKNAGVVSVEESKTTLLAQESQLRQDRFRVLADLADRQATLAAFTKLGVAASGAADAANIRVPGLDQYEEYEALRQQIKVLMVELQKNTGLDPSVAQVRKLHDQLEATKERKAHLEKTFPGLRRVPGGIPGVSTAEVLPDVDTQNAIVKGLEARATQLSNDLHVVRTEIEKINDLENEIAPVVVRRDLLKVQYASVARQLQDERLEGALANGQSASVSRVQNPSPATRDLMSLLKAMLMAIVGGLGGGVALAFLMELWLDRTLKRPKDVEQALRAPLLVSIPKLRLKPKRRAAQLNGKVVGNGHGGGSGPAQEAFSEGRERVAGLQPFHESIRDSLVNYFEARQMTHKPKLIAVTSCADGAGVSSIANGLAASLSQTGDGNVLLVDMRAERSEAHAFCEGKPVCGLEEALEGGSRTSALVQENLYLATADSSAQKLQRIIPRHFGHIVPKLKASDYEYIIFDMPPVRQTSITSKVARFMDMVLVVVEWEKTDRDVAKRAGLLLSESKTTVATVLNKRRRFVPAWLQQDFD